jgi:hypothetical protein
MERSTYYRLFVGIDIAATTFTAAWMPTGATPTALVTHPQRPAFFNVNDEPGVDAPLAQREIVYTDTHRGADRRQWRG